MKSLIALFVLTLSFTAQAQSDRCYLKLELTNSNGGGLGYNDYSWSVWKGPTSDSATQVSFENNLKALQDAGKCPAASDPNEEYCLIVKENDSFVGRLKDVYDFAVVRMSESMKYLIYLKSINASRDGFDPKELAKMYKDLGQCQAAYSTDGTEFVELDL